MPNKKIPQTHEAHLVSLQHLNDALAKLMEQGVACEQTSAQSKQAKAQTHLLITCLIPNMTKDNWQAYLKKTPMQNPCLEACAALEIQHASTPHLYTYMQTTITQMNTRLQDTKTPQPAYSSQVNMKEKQFLFFGAMDHV